MIGFPFSRERAYLPCFWLCSSFGLRHVALGLPTQTSLCTHSPEHLDHGCTQWAALARLDWPSRADRDLACPFGQALCTAPPSALSGEVGYDPGDPFTCSPSFRLQQEPIHLILLSPASHKPGETDTVTPSWQMPLVAIQFPRETSIHKARVPSCPAPGNQTMPTTLATAVPSPVVCDYHHCATYCQEKDHSALVVYIAPDCWSGREGKEFCRAGEGRVGSQWCSPEGPSVSMS